MFALDTHVHTCLSPCAELEMHPAAVIGAARAAGLAGIAVCDHNAAGNLEAAARAGRRSGLYVVPGIEITSAEEAHVQALLPDVAAAVDLAARVQAVLPGSNDPVFGLQVLADEDENVLGYDEHLLSGATTWTLEEVVAEIHRAGGLAVGAHVDRETFGIIGQLGSIPDDLPLDALELSAHVSRAQARRTFALRGQALLCGSDAHRPAQVGEGVTFFHVQEPSFAELRLALNEREGRAVLGGGRPMEDLSLHILDIAENAAEAGASAIDISLVEDAAADSLVIEITDNGHGMRAGDVAQALDPFFTTRTTRKVGLGLALLAQAARATGGDVEIESRPGEGTRVRARFGYGHVDRQPLGDIESTLMVLSTAHDGVAVTFRHEAHGRAWTLDSQRLARQVGAPLASPEGLAALRTAVREGERMLEQAASATASERGGS